MPDAPDFGSKCAACADERPCPDHNPAPGVPEVEADPGDDLALAMAAFGSRPGTDDRRNYQASALLHAVVRSYADHLRLAAGATATPEPDERVDVAAAMRAAGWSKDQIGAAMDARSLYDPARPAPTPASPEPDEVNRCESCPVWDGAECGGCYLTDPPTASPGDGEQRATDEGGAS